MIISNQVIDRRKADLLCCYNKCSWFVRLVSPDGPRLMVIRNSTAYSFIADVLRREILRGTLGAGQKMPPERELGSRFSASRITIRRALQILADELLVVRRQGSGTYVSATPSRKIPLLN